MAVSINSGFPRFADKQGNPLEGRVYFGNVNGNPKATQKMMYWDKLLTQPVSQPVDVIGGYMMRAGTPATVFTSQDYSMVVESKNGTQVFYSKSSTEFDNSIQNSIALDNIANFDGANAPFNYNNTFAAGTLGKWLKDLAASGGSTFVGWGNKGANALTRTVSDRLRDWVDVKDYATFQDAINTGFDIVISSPTTIAQPIVTIPEGKRLIFRENGTLTISTGTTLNVSEIEAPDRQIFYLAHPSSSIVYGLGETKLVWFAGDKVNTLNDAITEIKAFGNSAGSTTNPYALMWWVKGSIYTAAINTTFVVSAGRTLKGYGEGVSYLTLHSDSTYQIEVSGNKMGGGGGGQSSNTISTTSSPIARMEHMSIKKLGVDNTFSAPVNVNNLIVSNNAIVENLSLYGTSINLAPALADAGSYGVPAGTIIKNILIKNCGVHSINGQNRPPLIGAVLDNVKILNDYYILELKNGSTPLTGHNVGDLLTDSNGFTGYIAKKIGGGVYWVLYNSGHPVASKGGTVSGTAGSTTNNVLLQPTGGVRIVLDGSIVSNCVFSNIGRFTIMDSKESIISNIIVNSGGVYLENSKAITLSNIRSYVGKEYGFLVNSTCYDISFTNCEAHNSMLEGFNIQHHSSNTIKDFFSIVSCKAYNNGVQNTNTYAGIRLSNSPKRFTIQGCSSGNNSRYGASTQKHGIVIENPLNTGDFYSVIGNVTSDNIGAGIIDQPDGGNKFVAGNF